MQSDGGAGGSSGWGRMNTDECTLLREREGWRLGVFKCERACCDQKGGKEFRWL